MPKLKETLYPFGESCQPFTPETELTEDQKTWLIESGRVTEESFTSEKKEKTQKENK